MKEKIIIFAIGLLAGSVIASGAFYVYSISNANCNNGNTQMNEDFHPKMPNGEMGEPPELPSGEANESSENSKKNKKSNSNTEDTKSNKTEKSTEENS